MKKLSKSELKKKLRCLDQPELIDLVTRLHAAVPEAANYLSVELGGGSYELELLADAKKAVRNEFYPARGDSRLSLSTARKAIREFGHASKDPANYIDLKLYYVECGVEFTNDFGDIDDRFYSSMESMYQDVVDTLEKLADEALIRQFNDRLAAVVEKTKDIGWGFHDYLREAYLQLADE